MSSKERKKKEDILKQLNSKLLAGTSREHSSQAQLTITGSKLPLHKSEHCMLLYNTGVLSCLYIQFQMNL